jgi:hypothetical protein
MLKKYMKCGCGCDDFKLTEITDDFGDVLKIKICKDCGVIFKRE